MSSSFLRLRVMSVSASMLGVHRVEFLGGRAHEPQAPDLRMRTAARDDGAQYGSCVVCDNR